MQLEDRQIIRRSLNRDFPFGRALCSPAIFRTMLVSEDGFDGLEIECGTAAVDERLKHLFHVPAHLKDQVATVFDLIVGVLIMEPAALLFVEVEGEAKRSAEWEVAVERPTYDLTIFKLHCGKLTLKIYTKGERVLRIEVVAHNTRELNCGRSLDKFPEVVSRLKSVLERFADALSCIDQCFIADEMLEQLPAASRVGKTIVGGIDLNKARMRRVIEALLALSSSPNGFTASEVAARVRALSKQNPLQYGPRHAAYDLKKLRGKHIIRRIGHTRRYEPLLTGLRAMTALLVLRDKAIKPLLSS